MIKFDLNGKIKTWQGDKKRSLLNYLREHEHMTSAKDGCSGQAYCGMCAVEMDGRVILSCTTPMSKVNRADILTIEGWPENIRHTISASFVEKGAVQCGFCTPGILVRTKVLLQKNPKPSHDDIVNALKGHFCRCTGYAKIIEAIQLAAQLMRENQSIDLKSPGLVGTRQPKYNAFERAVGSAPFVDDLHFDGMLHVALKFSDHPRARVNKIDVEHAKKLPGVVEIFTGADIPGERYCGLIKNDWPVFILEGETTSYIGDVLAGVVAQDEETARQAVALIKVEYEVLEPLTNMHNAEDSSIHVHPEGNVLETTIIRRGEPAEEALASAAFVVRRSFDTQRIEHAFAETEAAVARPWGDDGIEIFSQSQGVYEDRTQLARLLNLDKKKINVHLVPTGGGFGGKEDMTVQPHAALYAWLLKRPVKLHLSRDESIRLHPKRHPVHLEYELGCDVHGKLSILKARIIGDTGAYASVGMKVLERCAGHAAGAYHVPSVDIVAKALYTNNVPCGAMRGFGVNQANFALESCIDELCEMGGFDRWQFRYDNALTNGLTCTTGQVLEKGVGVRETLLAVKEDFYNAKYSGISCGLKNTGIGNGMNDESEAKIEIKSPKQIIIHHGWTEMGQGVDTIALQTLVQETGLDPALIEVKVSTEFEAVAGMTTASRATSLLGNAVINAAKELRKDLTSHSLSELTGRIYSGKWVCDWTTKPGEPGDIRTHYSYGYATQLVVLDDNGNIDTVYAAHDAGKIINPTLFEGQIEGAVHMGLGYAFSEELPMQGGFIVSTKMKDLGILKAGDMPKVVVIGVEVKDPLGPYGAKGVGEIGLVPTAGAVANALYQFDGIRRMTLPMKRKEYGFKKL
jgi:aldehyde oxidoreductase